MLVSEMEKKAETTSRTTKTISSVWSGISSKCNYHRVENSKSVSVVLQTVSRQRGCDLLRSQCNSRSALQQHFEHELASDVGEHQRQETGKRPAHRYAPA